MFNTWATVWAYVELVLKLLFAGVSPDGVKEKLDEA